MHPLAIFLLLSLAATPILAQQYYRWVDERGVVHFSQTPPPDISQAAEQARLQRLPEIGASRAPSTTTTTGSPSAQATPDDEPGNPQAMSQSFGKDPALCEQVLQSLDVLSRHETVVMTDPETGDGIYLSANERTAEIARLQNMRAYYC